MSTGVDAWTILWSGSGLCLVSSGSVTTGPGGRLQMLFNRCYPHPTTPLPEGERMLPWFLGSDSRLAQKTGRDAARPCEFCSWGCNVSTLLHAKSARLTYYLRITIFLESVNEAACTR